MNPGLSLESGPKTKRTNLKDLSSYLGLSQTTISFVLNDAPLAKKLTQETRQRVLDAARKLHYRPSYFAVNLNKSGSESVGVLVPDHGEGYFAVVMGAVERCLLQRDYVYFTACHHRQPKLMREYPQLLMKRGAEGLLLLETDANFVTPLPVVTLCSHKPREGVTNIGVDHGAAARLVIRHLYDRGHRKIAFMRGRRKVSDATYRWEATMQVARDFGVQPTPERIVQLGSSEWSPEMGYEPTKRLLQVTQDFSALVCVHDWAAVGAIRALQEEGIDVPRDVSVVGFDDIVGAAFHTPRLTTIRQPLRRMGQLAATILLDRIAQPEREYAGTVLVKPELIVRESTGPAAV
ncbi:MAG TPA: LacI family DNA-binding transcriptional regulator [Granulicella sp.]|jgi:DNA-binding LacI/PurR family transcriptional regulator|nr:LacI family DNA-binding transcriptional regulator [Granulicella sp.]